MNGLSAKEAKHNGQVLSSVQGVPKTAITVRAYEHLLHVLTTPPLLLTATFGRFCTFAYLAKAG